MQNYLKMVKALACDKRLRMVMALRGGEIREGALAEMVHITPSAASRHLQALTNAGLVGSEKRGNCVYYRLALAGRVPLVDETLGWVDTCLQHDPLIIEDLAQVKRMTRRRKQPKPRSFSESMLAKRQSNWRKPPKARETGRRRR